LSAYAMCLLYARKAKTQENIKGQVKREKGMVKTLILRLLMIKNRVPGINAPVGFSSDS